MARIVGAVLVVLGVAGLVFGGFRLVYPDEVAKVGNVHLTVQRHRSVFVPPLLGITAVIGGVALLAFTRRASG